MEKIAAMHKLFGYGQGICKDCSNLLCVAENRRHYKCRAYGITHSIATDWAQRWIACGMKDKPTNGLNPVYRNKPKKIIDDQIEGQMNIEDFLQ